MRIRTLLQTSFAIGALMVMGLALTSWFITAKLAEVSHTQQHAQAAAHDISALLVLADEYSLYSGERAAQQWKALQATILANLEESANGAVPVPPEALAEAKLLPELFLQQATFIPRSTDLQHRRKILLLNQLQTSSQILADSVQRWSMALAERRQRTEHAFRILAITIPILMLLILALLNLLLNFRVLHPLTQLLQAVRATARGDLTVRSATGKHDELGELSATFDAMAIDLVSELQMEISERKRAEAERGCAEEALRESEFFFRESQRSAHIGSYKADFTADRWESSEVLDIIFGISKEYDRSIPGWLNIVHPDDREMMGRYLEDHVITQRKPFSKDYRIIRQSDGAVRWVFGLGEAKFDSQGCFAQLFGTIQDITERRLLEGAKVALEQQLQQARKLESLGALAGGIAHDFNNILMAILGNTDLALMRLPEDSPARENLDRIEQSAGRAADLAKQMLAYSGKGRYVVEELDLNRLLEGMQLPLERSISRQAVLRLELGQALPRVAADASQMRQIVMNLVSNASEAMDDRDGVIALSTGNMSCDTNDLKDVWLDENLPEGPYVYLEVADTGCGIDQETLVKIFDPFFSTKFTGRGLGMAAVLGIIRGHKGAIKVQSEVGKGTSFKVLLPACRKDL